MHDRRERRAPGAAAGPPGRAAGAGRRGGFTLTEMLVVVGILALLTAVTVPAVLEALEGRSVRESASQVGAVLTAARNRAIHQQRVYGVRLLREASNPWLVSQLEYVATPDPYTRGLVDVTQGGTGVAASAGFATSWDGIIRAGDQIRINGSGRIYTIGAVNPVDTITLTQAYVGPDGTAVPYQIFRQPAPVAGTEPITLSHDVVINVRFDPFNPLQTRSINVPDQVPPDLTNLWGLDGQPGRAGVDDDGDAAYTGQTDEPSELGDPRGDDVPGTAWPTMDILFGPNGLPSPASLATASDSVIHLWVEKRGTESPFEGVLLVSVFTRTGFAQSNELDATDLLDPLDIDGDANNNEPDGFPDDPYRFAEEALGTTR